MGNSDNNFCKNSNYMCNIFPMRNDKTRNSISLPKRNFDIKNITTNSLITNEYVPNQSQMIENGGKITDISNTNNSNVRSFQKQNKQFILLNPKTRNSNRLNIYNTTKSIDRSIGQLKSNTFSKSINRLNINNKNKKLFITDLKHNFNYKSNFSNINNFNNYSEDTNKINENNYQLKSNISTEEENTINNCSLTDNSLNSIQESPIKNNNQINDINNNISEDINENEENNKINQITEIKEIDENDDEFINEERDINEKEKKLYDKSNNTKILNEDENKEKKNLIKGLKIYNFRYSQKTLIQTHHTRKHFTILQSQRPNIKEKDNTKDNLNLDNSNHSIPEARHIDPNHPLNFLLIKRQIKSSLLPLNKKSFNIIIYKEDNSEQYSYFENGIANGITKYIISKKYKIIFEGYFENGFPKGYGKYSLINEGRYYEGIWDQNILLGIETWKDGTVYIGEFQDNKKNGIGMYRWPDGTIYSGEWKNDTMDGFCYIQFGDNRKFEGQMLSGVKNGYGEYTWSKKRKFIGNYVNDLKEGFGIYIWNIKTFEVYIGFWYKGKMEGIGMIIKGNKKHYGKWSRGEKIKQFKNERELKLKYKSTELIMATNIISQTIKMQKETNNKKDMNRCSVINVAKSQIEGCINFMCQDIKIIKNFIISSFFKTNSFS